MSHRKTAPHTDDDESLAAPELPNTRLRPSTRIAEADWLLSRLAPFGYCVASIVPCGFAAYVRVLHPAYESNGQAVRWSEVAARSDRIMHRLAQFHAIQQSADSSPELNTPEDGNLPADQLTAICSVLAEHTSAPASCCFGLWEGHGWLPEFSVHATALKHMPLVRLPNRNYYLLEGPLNAACELGWHLPDGSLVSQSPNLFWPSDRAWCVASEIDLPCTFVAGTDDLAERLTTDPRVEAWRVFEDDPITRDSDAVNSAD